MTLSGNVIGCILVSVVGATDYNVIQNVHADWGVYAEAGGYWTSSLYSDLNVKQGDILDFGWVWPGTGDLHVFLTEEAWADCVFSEAQTLLTMDGTVPNESLANGSLKETEKGPITFRTPWAKYEFVAAHLGVFYFASNMCGIGLNKFKLTVLPVTGFVDPSPSSSYNRRFVIRPRPEFWHNGLYDDMLIKLGDSLVFNIVFPHGLVILAGDCSIEPGTDNYCFMFPWQYNAAVKVDNGRELFMSANGTTYKNKPLPIQEVLCERHTRCGSIKWTPNASGVYVLACPLTGAAQAGFRFRVVVDKRVASVVSAERSNYMLTSALILLCSVSFLISMQLAS